MGWRVAHAQLGAIDIGPQLTKEQTLSIGNDVRADFRLLGVDLGGLEKQPRWKPSLLAPNSCSSMEGVNWSIALEPKGANATKRPTSKPATPEPLL
jgi:hypothetical protein